MSTVIRAQVDVLVEIQNPAEINIARIYRIYRIYIGYILGVKIPRVKCYNLLGTQYLPPC